MKEIDVFIDSVYQNVGGNKKEIQDLKAEMKSHLIEAVHELKAEGKTEQEAIEIAINRFGGEKVIWRKWNTNNRNDYFIDYMYYFCV